MSNVKVVMSSLTCPKSTTCDAEDIGSSWTRTVIAATWPGTSLTITPGCVSQSASHEVGESLKLWQVSRQMMSSASQKREQAWRAHARGCVQREGQLLLVGYWNHWECRYVMIKKNITEFGGSKQTGLYKDIISIKSSCQYLGFVRPVLDWRNISILSNLQHSFFYFRSYFLLLSTA